MYKPRVLESGIFHQSLGQSDDLETHGTTEGSWGYRETGFSSHVTSLCPLQHLLDGRYRSNTEAVAQSLLPVLGKVLQLVPCPVPHADPQSVPSSSLSWCQLAKLPWACSIASDHTVWGLVFSGGLGFLPEAKAENVIASSEFSPSSSILHPKATKLFTLSILKHPCTLLGCWTATLNGSPFANTVSIPLSKKDNDWMGVGKKRKGAFFARLAQEKSRY